MPKPKPPPTRPQMTIAQQVMWNRLLCVVEEQAQVLIRTAFSTSVREAGDLSAGVFDRHGRMLAQAVTGTPGHVNAMADSVAHFIRHIGQQNIFAGDIYLTNDPWLATGHLHDITFVTPSFYRNNLIGYFASTAHVVDIGGRGFGADADSVYEEGLRIPIMKFAERGEVNHSLLQLVRSNVRVAEQVVGDLYSLANCNETGQRRLLDMLTEFGIDNLDALADFILQHSHRTTLERIAKLPRRSAHNRMVIDGYDQPLELCVRLDIAADHILADFSGTAGLSRRGINVPLVYTKAYSCYGLKCAVAADIPNNAGSLSPFRVTAPVNCILNAQHPAPVSVRHVTGHFVPDLVLGALHQLLPGQIPAEGASALWNFHISTRPVEGAETAGRAEVLMFNSGGSGGRAQSDGLNATAFPSGVHTMPVEVTEQVGPIVIWKKQLRADSGGAGEYRGGLGQSIQIGARRGYEFDFSAMFDRVTHAARGREGGHAGQPGRVTLDDARVLKTKGKQFVPSARRLCLELPGGGGYGAPTRRSAARIAQDLADGYITAAAAARDYGDVNLSCVESSTNQPTED